MGVKLEPTQNLRVEYEPYPHLRDSHGVVLARDYAHEPKLRFIIEAVGKAEKDATLQAPLRHQAAQLDDSPVPPEIDMEELRTYLVEGNSKEDLADMVLELYSKDALFELWQEIVKCRSEDEA